MKLYVDKKSASYFSTRDTATDFIVNQSEYIQKLFSDDVVYYHRILAKQGLERKYYFIEFSDEFGVVLGYI